MYIRKRSTHRQRVLILLLGLLALIMVLGWWQAHARRANSTSPVDSFLLELISPSMRMADAVRNRVTPAPPPSPDALSPVSIARLRQLEQENSRLRALLALQDTLPRQGIAADVIGRSETPWPEELLLGKGRREGIGPRMVVLTPEGVVGQVVKATPHVASVLPLTDAASGIGALVERTGAAGVLKGDGRGQCLLAYLSSQADIQPGDLIVTSGLGHIYMKGLPLGVVRSVHLDQSISSQAALVEPAANLQGVAQVVVLR